MTHFENLSFCSRGNLQQWIKSNPELGEPLKIIWKLVVTDSFGQKESNSYMINLKNIKTIRVIEDIKLFHFESDQG